MTMTSVGWFGRGGGAATETLFAEQLGPGGCAGSRVTADLAAGRSAAGVIPHARVVFDRNSR